MTSLPLPETTFDYVVRVQPHHTDYGGVVWHGTYIAWMEEARVEYLRSRGVDFTKWVHGGVDLPVVDLSMQYRQPLTLGMEAVVKSWLAPKQGIRIVWHYAIQNKLTQATCVSGQVTLVAVDIHQRKVLRRLPDAIQADFDRLYE